MRATIATALAAFCAGLAIGATTLTPYAPADCMTDTECEQLYGADDARYEQLDEPTDDDAIAPCYSAAECRAMIDGATTAQTPRT